MATLNKHEVEGVRLLRLSGSLTQSGVESLSPDFDAALPDGSRAVVDLADVDLITTPGLTLIIAATKRLRDSRGRVVFTAAQEGVLNMLRRCRLDEVIELADDQQQAVSMVQTA